MMTKPASVQEQADEQSVFPSCPLLALSAELRNLIYDFVFTPHRVFSEVYPDKTELLKSRPPPKAILQVNRRLYQETRLVYRDAYRSYWINSQFCLTQEDWDGIKGAKDDDLNHVEHLTIRVDGASISTRNIGLYKHCWTYELVEQKRKGSGEKLLRRGWKESQLAGGVLKNISFVTFSRDRNYGVFPGREVRQLYPVRQGHKTLDRFVKWAPPLKDPVKGQIMAIRRQFYPEEHATEDEWCHWLERYHVQGCVCYADEEERDIAAGIRADYKRCVIDAEAARMAASSH